MECFRVSLIRDRSYVRTWIRAVATQLSKGTFQLKFFTKSDLFPKVHSFEDTQDVDLDVGADGDEDHSGRGRHQGEVDGLHGQPEDQGEEVGGNKLQLPFL